MHIHQPRASSSVAGRSGNWRYGLFSLVVVMAAGVMLSGCNTTAGAGQDIKATGQTITHDADAVKSKL